VITDRIGTGRLSRGEAVQLLAAGVDKPMPIEPIQKEAVPVEGEGTKQK
jgi:hypothetical protein